MELLHDVYWLGRSASIHLTVPIATVRERTHSRTKAVRRIAASYRSLGSCGDWRPLRLVGVDNLDDPATAIG